MNNQVTYTFFLFKIHVKYNHSFVYKQKIQNFEKWTKRYEFRVCFCEIMPYHSQKFLEWLN